MYIQQRADDKVLISTTLHDYGDRGNNKGLKTCLQGEMKEQFVTIGM